MRKFLVILLSVCIVFLPACSLFTPQQRSAAEQVVNEEYAAGNLTSAQRDAAIEALQSDGNFDWTGLGVAGVNIMLAILGGGYLGARVVRSQRGPVATPVERVARAAAAKAGQG